VIGRQTRVVLGEIGVSPRILVVGQARDCQSLRRHFPNSAVRNESLEVACTGGGKLGAAIVEELATPRRFETVDRKLLEIDEPTRIGRGVRHG
jgi:hypothetical protein